MKKFFIVLFLLLSTVSASYAASEDMSVYVRQDVFDAKMETLFNRLHSEISELKTEVKAEINGLRSEVKAEINGLRSEVKAEINGLRTEVKSEINGLRTEVKSEISELRGDVKALSARMDGLEKRMDSLDKRIDDTHNFLYLILVLLGAMLLLPSINKWWEGREEKKRSATSLTVDDVKRLIVEVLSNRTAQVS